MLLPFLGLALCVLVLLIPSDFDPAIRLKEFNERWRKRQ